MPIIKNLNMPNPLKLIDNYPLFRDTFTTTIWNILGKGMGLLIPFFIAACYGVSLETDIFFFLYGFILYLTSIVAISVKSNIVPFIAKIKSEQKVDTSLFASRLFSIILLIAIGLTIIFVIFARPIFSLITNFPKDSQGLLFQLFLATSPLLVLIILSSVLEGVLNAYFKFWLPAISPGIRAAICIATILCLM